MSGFLFFSVTAGVLAIAAISVFIGIYNRLVGLRQQVTRAWGNIEVILKQRHDEIPQLIEVLEQFVKYEQSILNRLVEARKQYGQAQSIDQKIQASNKVSGALRGILALGEAYPELKSNNQFVQLQNRISGLESQLSDRRELYNDTVTNLNTRIHQIPDVFIAQSLGYSEMELFHIEDSEKERPSLKMKLSA